MTDTLVINYHHDPVPSDAINIMRNGGRWGNQFDHRTLGRQMSLYRYAWWLHEMVVACGITLEELAALHGETLVCGCKPKACHGDILALAAEWAHDVLRARVMRSETSAVSPPRFPVLTHP